MFDSNEDWCEIWRKTDLCFLKWYEEFCKFLFTSWKIDFILESKMAELNKNKQKFKTTRSTKCNVKTLFYLGNKWISQLTKLFSKKVVKLCSFLQCSIHIILCHDGCIWKINLRILWSHFGKNFQVTHGQCDNIIFTQNIFFWRF